MAILTGGLLGKSRKSIGDMVTYVMGGQQIARMKPASYDDANTEAQQLQRNSFALTVQLYRIMMASVKVNFPERESKHSAYNSFMMYNTPEAVSGPLGSQTIDFSVVIMSRGSLLKPADANAVSNLTDRVEVSWRDNTNDTTGFENDLVVISLYNPDKDEAASSILETTRDAVIRELTTPASWQGDTVHVWLNFVKDDLSKASDSVYAGNVIVSA